MAKMSIEEAAKFLGVSKEAIHNRIRRGTVTCIIEDGVKYVDIQNKPPNQQAKKSTTNQNFYESKYYQHLEEQNKELQEKVKKLEDETKLLREQKEQMLIAEKIKIEQIYKEKDEQLKNILNAISTKFLTSTIPSEEDETLLDVEIEEKPKLVSLKKWLKPYKLKQKKLNQIDKKIVKLINKKDKRFIVKKEKIYLQPDLYDYKTLFKIK